jgi:class 3 adenylate cyclase
VGVSDTWGDRAGNAPVRRISDDDRLQVVTRLREAAGQGAIGLDELEERIEATYEAKTVFDLEPITADLPIAAAPPSAVKVPHRRPLVMEDDEFRSHFTVYALVIGMLIVIWLASGAGHPWPIYPAAGWGIGIGSHYQVAATHQRKRLARARSLGITLAELEIREAEERKAKRKQRRAQRAAQFGGHGRHGQGRYGRYGSSPAVDTAMEYAESATETALKHVEKALQRAVPPVPSPPPADGTTQAQPAAGHGGTTRFVVAMFVDVVGSTGLNEALGDDGWVRVRGHLQDVLRECFEREGGWEVNSAGDGILARFEHPNSATCAAVEIQRRLARQREETGFAPSVRIGIHSGDAVEVGDDLIGGVVNLASRVTGAGEPDQITVTEHVADHLDPSFDTEDRGIHSLKGVSRPRHLLAVRWH